LAAVVESVWFVSVAATGAAAAIAVRVPTLATT
jgi:hypothetical protein